MFVQINVDCCKTIGCKNLGILNSPDYVLQGNNVLCRGCGFAFPIISERSLNRFRQAANHPWKGLIRQCPTCGGTSLKKYGFSAPDKHRLYCRECDRTFVFSEQCRQEARRDRLSMMIDAGVSLQEIRHTLSLDSTGLGRALIKLNRKANQAERRLVFPSFDITLCTRAFTVKYNGSDNRLYVLVTAEEKSGKVVSVTTNYSALPVEPDYQYCSCYEERMPPGTLIHLIQRKELMTMRRETLYDIDYGTAALHQNDPGMLVKPVLAAYRHFELIRILTDDRALNTQHFLDNECFLFGGCIMANVQYIADGRCHIAFVKERGTSPPQKVISPRLFSAGGIRNNIWYAFNAQNYSMAVCDLTGKKKTSTLRHATLRSASRFIDYLENHPFLPSLNRMSPANVTATLDYLKHHYNQYV